MEADITEIKADEQLQEVMKRTMINLRFIYGMRTDCGPYEFVQLVNSFLGAFVHPWEAMKDDDPLGLQSVSLQEAQDIFGWPVLKKKPPDEETHPPSYWHMLQWTRHAFAHENMRFLNAGGQVVGIELWNSRDNERRWGTKLGAYEMEGLLWFLHDLTFGQWPKPSMEHRRIFAHAAD